MINRKRTMEVYGYDPDGPAARSRKMVVWIYSCCGFELHTVRHAAGKNARCTRCAYLKRKTDKPVRIDTQRLFLTQEERIIHGQRVTVKIYRTGVPSDYLPAMLDDVIGEANYAD